MSFSLFYATAYSKFCALVPQARVEAGVEQENQKVVGLVNDGAKKDRMEQGTAASSLIGNDEHISGHPHNRVFEKGALIMKTFKEDEDQGVGKPTWKRDCPGDLEQGYEEDQSLEDRSEDDGGEGTVGIHLRSAELSAKQPMNPRRQIKVKKGNEQ